MMGGEGTASLNCNGNIAWTFKGMGRKTWVMT